MFKVPNYDPKARVNRFQFRVPKRRGWQRSRYSMPFLAVIPITVMQEARGLSPLEQLGKLMELLDETDAVKALARLSPPEIKALQVAWLEASLPGESLASLSSLVNTRGQSEETSSETASVSSGSEPTA